MAPFSPGVASTLRAPDPAHVIGAGRIEILMADDADSSLDLAAGRLGRERQAARSLFTLATMKGKAAPWTP